MSLEKTYGIHAVIAVLKTNVTFVQKIYLQESRNDQALEQIKSLAEQAGLPVKFMSRQAIDMMFDHAVTHQGVVADLSSLPSYDESDLMDLMDTDQVPLLLVLDGVQDPHNLGACLRTANAMGVHAVIAPKDRAVGMTAAVRKVACGAAEMTPFIAVSNLSRTLKKLKAQGIWLVGAMGEAESSIAEIDMTGPIAIVMGSEDKGLRRLTREHCDYLARIPMAGAVGSFNVSVATGICLYEVIRQR
jgi:23S rRNA (guanosine2251-2'-O)-methyltransferase